MSSPTVRSQFSSIAFRQRSKAGKNICSNQGPVTVSIPGRLAGSTISASSIVFRGERLDLAVGRAFMTEVKRQNLSARICRFLSQGQLPFYHAESLLRLIGASYPTVPLDRLHSRALQIEVLRRIRQNQNVTSPIPLSPKQFSWLCLPSVLASGVPFCLP